MKKRDEVFQAVYAAPPILKRDDNIPKGNNEKPELDEYPGGFMNRRKPEMRCVYAGPDSPIWRGGTDENAAVYCVNCGRKSEEGDKFCRDCGTKLVRGGAVKRPGMEKI